ncbi:MAG: DNA translocase FtsK [Elusimicrobia bacterium]|nr:DNA translocase FtsK [Elusimicrobiota bacterium]
MTRQYRPKNRYAVRRKASGGASGRWLGTLLWIAFAFLAAWLVWVMWGSDGKGVLGEAAYRIMNGAFGHAAYLFPFLILYGLAKVLRNSKGGGSYGIFTLSAGVLLCTAAFASEFSLLKTHVFTDSALYGGAVGDFLSDIFRRIFGAVGAGLLGLALLAAGVQTLFEIPWASLFNGALDYIKEDFHTWLSARAEMKAKAKEAKERQGIAIRRADANPSEAVQPGQEKPRELEIRRGDGLQAKAEAAPKTAKKTAKEAAKPEEQPVPAPQTSKVIEIASKIKPKSAAEKEADTPAEKEQAAEPQPPREYVLPSTTLLAEPPQNSKSLGPTETEIKEAAAKLEQTLKSFDIDAEVTGVSPGPVVTRYELRPKPGVKVSSVVALSNDIALAMKARGIRVEAPIPGKDAIGFEIPNDEPAMVVLREILEHPSFTQKRGHLTVALGRHAEGAPATANLEKMPHLLVAGATNSGKSICLQTIIMSLLFRNKPDQVKFLMIDPKRLELTFYDGIPHLYDPKCECGDVSVVTNPKEAVKSLQALVRVMEKRYMMFELAKVKNIESYNKWAVENGHTPAFYIVVVIDELADLMMQTRASVEDSIQRLAQMARAVGIHLVLSTQRPSVDVITGVIKANLPSRIALQVASKMDSKVILDSSGAESLLGKGDMLYLAIDAQKPSRIQGAYVSEDEIQRTADFLRQQGGPQYETQLAPEKTDDSPDGLGASPEEMIQALTLITERRRVSQDLLKAHFGSSARATNLLSLLETKGFISKPEGSNRWDIAFDKIEHQLSVLESEKLLKTAMGDEE